MSHKFTVDKAPKGLAFQIQVADPSRFRKRWIDANHQNLAYPKRKAINSCGFKDEGDKPDCCCSSKRHYPSNVKLNNVDYKKVSQKNVFIDSYYPKVLGDCSEDYSKTSNSSPEENKEVWMKNPSESESMKTYETRGTRRKIYKKNESRKSDMMMIHKSSRSRLTLKCNTYTLISLNSDFESVFSSRNHLNICEGIPKARGQYEEREVTEDEECPKEDKSKILSDDTEECRESLSTTNYFTQLYDRIQNLEEFLQTNLDFPVNSAQDDEYKIAEKPETKRKLQPDKNKFVLPKNPELKNHLTYTQGVREASDMVNTIQEPEHSDTESELWKIKKRLTALERKLRESNFTLFSMAAGYPTAVNTILNETDAQKSKYSREMAKLKKRGPPKQLYSQATFIVPDNFIILSNKPKKEREKASLIGIIDMDKRKKRIKCKKIKRKTSSSIYSTRRKTFRPKKAYLKLNEKGFRVHSTLRVKSSQSGIFNNKSTTWSDLKSEYKTIIEKPRKKCQNKRNKLCKKTSITNMLLGQGEPTKLNDRCELIREGSDSKGLKRNRWPWIDLKFQNNPRPPCPCFMTVTGRHTRKSSHNSLLRKNCKYLELEKTKKTKLSDPIEILKSGGKIKIPVLFEEICKRSPSKGLPRKFSDVSMRFVMVQEGPKQPMRKLITTLSPNTENYLFGVSKCSCKSQIQSKAGGLSGGNERVLKIV